MTNPNNAVGTDGAYGGRTSVNAFNDNLAIYSGSGILDGWVCSAGGGMSVDLGGNGTDRDVAVAQDNAGNKTTINNISGNPINVVIDTSPATLNRTDLIVAYVDNPPTGNSTDVDNPGACGIIAVAGIPASTPVAPDDTAIRTAITADGASGATAYYVVLAQIAVNAGVTVIDAAAITQGEYAPFNTSVIPSRSILTRMLGLNSVGTSQLQDLSVTYGKLAGSATPQIVGTADNYCVKWPNGLMLAVQKVTLTGSITDSWGSCYSKDYTNASFPEFAVSFLAAPIGNVSVYSNSGLWVASFGKFSTTKLLGLTLARPSTLNSFSADIHIVAWGKWDQPISKGGGNGDENNRSIPEESQEPSENETK